MPTFSVIVPVYNVEKYIKQCLDSIKFQTFKDFEVICVDDCSTDNSAKIVEEYVQKDSRFKLIRHEQNKGVSAARNTALDAATGEYIIFVDSDDWVDTKFFEAINRAYKSNPTADNVWFNSYEYNNETGEKRLFDQVKRLDHLEQTNEYELLYIVGCLWDKSYKRSRIEEINLRFPEGLIVEDTEFTFKYFAKYPVYYMLNAPYYYYRKFRVGSYCTDDAYGERIFDQFKIIPHIYQFLKEQDLFPMYKITLLGLFCEYMQSVLYLTDKRQRIMGMAKDTLKQINFPEEYHDIDKSIDKIL